MTCRSYFQTAPLLSTVLSSCQGEVGYEYGTIVSSLPSLGVRRSTRSTSPPRSVHNHAELVVPVLRVLETRRSPTHARGGAARHGDAARASHHGRPHKRRQRVFRPDMNMRSIVKASEDGADVALWMFGGRLASVSRYRGGVRLGDLLV